MEEFMELLTLGVVRRAWEELGGMCLQVLGDVVSTQEVGGGLGPHVVGGGGHRGIRISE